MTAAIATPRVVIIGGGFTGSAVAVHLATQAIAPLAITIFEPRASLGGGVAYSSRDPAHRTNVAATRMSLYSDDEQPFRALADGQRQAGRLIPKLRLADGRIYVRRADIRRLRGGTGWRRQRAAPSPPFVTCGNARWPFASMAPAGASRRSWGGRSPPTSSCWPSATRRQRHRLGSSRPSAGCRASSPIPGPTTRSSGSAPSDDVLVMGTALSMADVVASLDRRGHRGKIVAFSRRGQISRPHAEQAHEAFGGFAERPPTTALELLVRLRGMLRDAKAAGQPWQAVIDAARRDGQTVWRALDDRQRRVLLRHLRPYWEVHRYRVAPQVGAVIERRRREGTLEIVAAALGEVAAEGQTMRCELRLRGRGGATGGTRWVEAQALVVTTGPAHGGILATNPALRSLAAPGWCRRTSMGWACWRTSIIAPSPAPGSRPTRCWSRGHWRARPSAS